MADTFLDKAADSLLQFFLGHTVQILKPVPNIKERSLDVH